MTHSWATDSFRWKNYVLFNKDTIDELWNPGYYRGKRSVLYIMGVGFDVRMNTGLTALLQKCPDLDVTCLVVSADTAGRPLSPAYAAATAHNLAELRALVPPGRMQERVIPLYAPEVNYAERQYMGDNSGATRVIRNWADIQDYQDIYLDISSLSRGVYISLAGKILYLLDAPPEAGLRPNFFILATENAVIDSLIQEEGLAGRPRFLYGFSLNSITFETRKPLLWLPILGEQKHTHLNETYEELKAKQKKMEIFPVLPFPSRDPRRSDNLVEEHHQLLFDKFRVEFDDVLYVPEQNPGEVYLGLVRTIARFHHAMQPLGGCRVAISPFSSKLLSVGAMLASYELHKYRQSVETLKERAIDVGIITTVTESYTAPARSELLRHHQDSEVFVTWVAGEPYAPLS